MLLRHAIGFVLRRLRLERGKTLRELAEEARISLPYLSEIERGRKEASSEILGVLCRVLDITERQLLTEVADEYALQREVASVTQLSVTQLSSTQPSSARNGTEMLLAA
jgi:transcriptional regulator with XRE-family HTH domain